MPEGRVRKLVDILLLLSLKCEGLKPAIEMSFEMMLQFAPPIDAILADEGISRKPYVEPPPIVCDRKLTKGRLSRHIPIKFFKESILEIR